MKVINWNPAWSKCYLMINLSVLNSKTEKRTVWQVFQQDNFPLNDCHLLCNYDIPAILMLRQSFFIFSSQTRENFRSPQPTALVIYCCVTNHPSARPPTANTYLLHLQQLNRASLEGLLRAYHQGTGWSTVRLMIPCKLVHICYCWQEEPSSPGAAVTIRGTSTHHTVTACGCTWLGSFLPSEWATRKDENDVN